MLLLSSAPWASRLSPSPVEDGNWVSLKSVEAVSILLCRSSKLTDGKKSKDAVELILFPIPTERRKKRMVAGRSCAEHWIVRGEAGIRRG
jgi:hypothetical protein